MLIYTLLLVFIFGFFGTSVRYFLLKQTNISGLFWANFSGVFLALLFSASIPLIVTGFCGSLTSFSALIKQGSINKLYLFITLIVSLLLFIFI